MKKKQLSIETIIDGSVCESLSVTSANMNTLGAVLELAPVGAKVTLDITEVEIPDFPLRQ